jgi:hypothetical protein
MLSVFEGHNVGTLLASCNKRARDRLGRWLALGEVLEASQEARHRKQGTLGLLVSLSF